MNTPAPGKAQMAWDVFADAFLAGAPNAKREGMRILLQSRGLLTDQGLVVNPEEAWLAVRHYQSPAIAAPPPPPRPPRPKPRQRSLAELLEMHEADPYAAGEAEYTPEEDEMLTQHFIKERIARNAGINGRIFNQ